MRTRAVPELLQWFGLFGGGIAWAVHLGLGFFVAQARCGAGSVHWGVDNTTWQVVLMIAAAAVVALAEAACILTILGTSDSTYEDVPPYGRRRFFALGAAAGNVLFLVAILLEGIGSIAHDPCRQL